MLSRKTMDEFDNFLDALDRTDQRHVRNHITGRQRMSLVIFLAATACSAERVLAIVILSDSPPPRPSTDSRSDEIETPGFHRMIA